MNNINYEKRYKEANDKVAARFGINVAKEIFTDLYESEDENIRKTLINYFNTCAGDYYGELNRKDILAWLEKQGGQKPTWNEEDKKLTDVNHEYFSELLENGNSKNINDYSYQVAYCMSHDWALENPTWDDVQKACKLGAEWNGKHHKSTWGEEDEKMYKGVKTVCDVWSTATSFYPKENEDVERLKNWLKSLKNRCNWKPTDEQMHAFKQVYDWYNNDFASSETLTSLYNDLMKLK